jgi:hypothetical protein
MAPAQTELKTSQIRTRNQHKKVKKGFTGVMGYFKWSSYEDREPRIGSFNEKWRLSDSTPSIQTALTASLVAKCHWANADRFGD